MNNGDRNRNGGGARLTILNGENGPSGGTSRRDFLKVLGVAGAGAAATSCGPPDMGDKLIPYLVPPEDIVPGTSVSYATILKEAGVSRVPNHLELDAGFLQRADRGPPPDVGPGRDIRLAGLQ